VCFPPFRNTRSWAGLKSACAKEPRGLIGLLSFAGLRFHGVGCGEFPISVWLGAPGTRLQFTSFLGRCTTRRTRHGYYLFQSEFLGFHRNIVQFSKAGKCSILLIFNTLAKRQVPFWVRRGMSKSEYLW
jgi:hypothetical protein